MSRLLLVCVVLFLLPSGGGWAEESAPLRGEAQRRQLIGLIGTWEFSLDLSPTVAVEDPIRMRYKIVDVDGDAVSSLASGVDLKDQSTFSIAVRPRIINSQQHAFYMYDEDMELGNPTCISYSFSQAGHHILGYFRMYKADLGHCSDEMYAVGVLTGMRRSVGN